MYCNEVFLPYIMLVTFSSICLFDKHLDEG